MMNYFGFLRYAIIFSFLMNIESSYGVTRKPKENLVSDDDTAVSTIKTDFSHVELTSDQKKNIESDKSYQQFLEKNENLEAAFDAIKKSSPDVTRALEKISKWNPTQDVFRIYKDFFTAIWAKNYNDIHKLYGSLKKDKKFIRLRLDLIAFLIKSETTHLKFEKPVDFIMQESRLLIRQMRGTSEGEIFESEYLKWLQKNKFFDEICATERDRWISETRIEYPELMQATTKCEVKFSDFLTRLRRLLFAAKDYQALREIELFSKDAKLADWEKAYLLAIFNSHSGDPVSGFQNLAKYEDQIMKTDYNDNYFFISQRAGELDKAERIIKKILNETKGKEYKNLKFQQGFLFYQTKKYKQAYAVFNDLYKSHPLMHGKKKRKFKYNRDLDQIAWLRAWTLYLDGQYSKALEAFDETAPYAIDEARLAYWVADTRMKLGDDGSAISSLRRLASPVLEQKSFSYYNLVAWLRYEKLKKEFQSNDVLKSIAMLSKMNKGPYPVASETLSHSQIMASYSFYEKEFFDTDEGEIQVINSENEVIENTDTAGITVNTTQELLEQVNFAKFLIVEQESDLARWHLYEIERRANTRKKAEVLAQFYLDQQFYYRALSLMSRYGNGSKVILSYKSDPLLWASLYPEAYKNIIFKYGEKRKIDPYMILSIMRAETKYKSDAISPVGAVGLMQFMPYSAQKVADMLSDSIQTEDLFTPEKSIEYGATYLKKLSVELENQKPLIAAAYNGGPHRVKAWIKNFGQDMDFDKFIEHIPFNETRTYVKRVITYRAIYDRLYNKALESDKYMYLLNPLPVKAEESQSLKEEWEPFRSKI